MSTLFNKEFTISCYTYKRGINIHISIKYSLIINCIPKGLLRITSIFQFFFVFVF